MGIQNNRVGIQNNGVVIIELMGNISSSPRVFIREDDVYKMKNIRKRKKKKENDKWILESKFSHNIKMANREKNQHRTLC